MPPNPTHVTFKLSDMCCHKDFGQTLPPLKIQFNTYWEVLMFTELGPALLLLWHTPHTDAEA